MSTYSIAVPQTSPGPVTLVYRAVRISMTKTGENPLFAVRLSIPEIHFEVERKPAPGRSDVPFYDHPVAMSPQAMLTIVCLVTSDGKAWKYCNEPVKKSDTTYRIQSADNALDIKIEFLPTYMILPPPDTIMKVEFVPCRRNLAMNGDFEDIEDRTPRLGLQGRDLRDWTITGKVDYEHWQAASGNRSLDLNGPRNAGGISQTIHTIEGQWYLVVFAMAGNPDIGPGVPITKMLEVSVGEGTKRVYRFDTAGKTREQMGWVDEEYRFMATANKTTITFSSKTPGGRGPTLDNVRIYAL